jgi:hypoxanthine-DNA glycosylase
LEPVYNEESKILILGSFPSVKSRECNFFYGHKQNRFWKVLASLNMEKTPESIEEKKAFLLRNKIAVWDVIAECDIVGSSDSSIKNVVATDLSDILQTSQLTRIFTNGKLAGKLYEKYQEKETKIKAVNLPSSSPANAVYTLDKLLETWKIIL